MIHKQKKATIITSLEKNESHFKNKTVKHKLTLSKR